MKSLKTELIDYRWKQKAKVEKQNLATSKIIQDFAVKTFDEFVWNSIKASLFNQAAKDAKASIEVWDIWKEARQKIMNEFIIPNKIFLACEFPHDFENEQEKRDYTLYTINEILLELIKSKVDHEELNMLLNRGIESLKIGWLPIEE